MLFFHSCPKDSGIKEQWFTFCGLNIEEGGELCLCQKHFLESKIQWKTKENGRTKLKKNAVPNLHPENLKVVKKGYSYTCQICVTLPPIPEELQALKKSYFRYPFKLIT